MYHLNSFHNFTKVVGSKYLVILSETVLLVAEHHLVFICFFNLSAPFRELKYLSLLLLKWTTT